MRDLELWRALLSDPGPPDAEAAPLLRALAGWPLERRWPALAAVQSYAQHERADVRAAAMACLCGARGRPALRVLVQGLNDDDPAVRQAAVHAFRASALGGGLRWVHVLFHPRPDVRRAALDPAAPFPLPHWYAVYLLPDPECAEAAAAVLTQAEVPTEALPVLVECLTTGSVARPILRRVVLATSLPALVTALGQPLPPPAEVAAALPRPGSAEGPRVLAGRYPLGDVLELFWDAPPAEGDALVRAWWAAFLPLPDTMRRATAALLLAIASRRGNWPAWAVRLLACCYPASLGDDGIPLGRRREAGASMSGLGDRAPWMTRGSLARLLRSPLCRTPAGAPDLPVMVGLLHLAHRKPYEQLTEAFGWPAVQAAVEQQPEQVLPLLRLPRAGRAERWGLIEWLLRVRSPRLDRVLADLPPDLTGAPAPAEAPTAVPEPPPPPRPALHVEAMATALTTGDLAEVFVCAAHPEAAVARLAARRAGELGTRARRAFVDWLERHRPARTDAILEAIVDWPERPPIGDGLSAELRFRLRLATDRRDGEDVVPRLLEAACEPETAAWLRPDDWDALAALPAERLTAFAPRLALCPHPFAYGLGVSALVRTTRHSAAAEQALLAFLEAGDDRYFAMRVEAARWLYRHGKQVDPRLLLPLLLADPQEKPPVPEALAGVPAATADDVTESVLIAGLGDPTERMVFALLSARLVDPGARERGLGRLTARAASAVVRRQAGQRLRQEGRLALDVRVRRLADVFAWGIRVGRELTGQAFGIEMITGEELGYTRLNERRLFISPLPYLLGHQQGEEVVRALILHEYGHHLYHKGEQGEGVWQQAEAEGLGRLLNLVADEHLERNLRARDRRFGNLLKTLAAYAFQHNAREVPVPALLNLLQGRAAQALRETRLGVARRPDCVTVSCGNLLRVLEEAGTSFARFVRALRMGLGDRHGDEKVARGLALFKGGFRNHDMQQLLEVTRKLRDIFGQETDLLSFLVPADADLLRDLEELLGQPISELNERLREEVRQILEGKSGQVRPDRDGRGLGGSGMNLGPDAEFDLIRDVVPLPHDPGRHAGYAARVGRAAQKMRQCLHDLGLGLRLERYRMRGRGFDRTRARALLLHGDPRILLARELRRVDDLFLGVVVDCSGSMAGQYIEKARLFGTLLAEAARDNRGIDLRLFGFTDQVIYDAGTARRCAAHALEAGGGNNDAGALWHAAQHALASPRRLRLLVMISDGLPTECTVTALRALVQRLTHRFHVCCAQVAVRPLEEVCFPHYILLQEDDLHASVTEFGAVILRLVRQVMRG
jgi:hypothetical protein